MHDAFAMKIFVDAHFVVGENKLFKCNEAHVNAAKQSMQAIMVSINESALRNVKQCSRTFWRFIRLNLITIKPSVPARIS